MVDTDTELFDLFGEPSYCTVCQEDIPDGERVRAVRPCQHIFHAACLEEWLRRKAECPLCRTPLPHLQGQTSHQTTVEQLQRIIQLLQAYDTATHTVDPFTHERNVLTYVLVVGVLKKFPKSTGEGGLRAASERIHQRLFSSWIHGFRAFPVDLSNHGGLKQLKKQIGGQLAEAFGCSVRAVPSRAEVEVWKGRVAALPAVGEVWTNF